MWLQNFSEIILANWDGMRIDFTPPFFPLLLRFLFVFLCSELLRPSGEGREGWRFDPERICTDLEYITVPVGPEMLLAITRSNS